MFYTSGVYAPGAPAKYGTDHHSTYLDWWLDFIGVADIETVRFQPSLLTADPAAKAARARQVAQLWRDGALPYIPQWNGSVPDRPARPERPQLVPPARAAPAA